MKKVTLKIELPEDFVLEVTPLLKKYGLGMEHLSEAMLNLAVGVFDDGEMLIGNVTFPSREAAQAAAETMFRECPGIPAEYRKIGLTYEQAGEVVDDTFYAPGHLATGTA